jgi:hypothetical protein
MGVGTMGLRSAPEGLGVKDTVMVGLPTWVVDSGVIGLSSLVGVVGVSPVVGGSKGFSAVVAEWFTWVSLIVGSICRTGKLSKIDWLAMGASAWLGVSGLMGIVLIS